ncbi:hypothetical protein ABU178_11640 [Pantoea osteomyelitidis]|uniref:Uncharacterized protein n=1 Tax=Pantoea osteomyelitidis TaxID=3230026 RepID=A0ABW7PWW1_9GAMM
MNEILLKKVKILRGEQYHPGCNFVQPCKCEPVNTLGVQAKFNNSKTAWILLQESRQSGKAGEYAGCSQVQLDFCEPVQPLCIFTQTTGEMPVTGVLNPLCAPRLYGRIPRRRKPHLLLWCEIA